jgi:hypothetical protein
MKISVNIASQPKRLHTLRQTIESFQAQSVRPDIIRVWWNGDELPEIEGVQFAGGKDLTDNGKFAFVRPNEIYFTADDDILYPTDYIEHTLQRLAVYPECVLSYHGRRLSGKGVRYYGGHTAFACLGHVGQDELIDVPGTGVMCFDTRYFKPNPFQYKQNRMADVLIGLEAVRLGRQVICLAHGMGWIRDNSPDGGIYVEARHSDKVQSQLCDQMYQNKLS